MFPNGWPGKGLLLLRVLAGAFVIHDGIAGLLGTPHWAGIVTRSMGLVAGLLLLAGLWTPAAGVLLVIVALCDVFLNVDDLRNSIVLATLGAALAMLGPGVRSIDARLFGRKRIDFPDR